MPTGLEAKGDLIDKSPSPVPLRILSFCWAAGICFIHDSSLQMTILTKTPVPPWRVSQKQLGEFSSWNKATS